ncbi:type II secretion system F family protein [Staphylococcus equorum]|uniref:Type II secretion system F family protein n=1 Tax=Staphylococcus equorum TaxID=246432 RepID=A0A9X4R012_9STAP|nr:competence type IV pilus assembly protein ComGB [Staphylococcus equorum]MDG0842542.1 type II secretion system F family protein [Staphylococcus equorum]MDG0858327.1 type II secretion system F family protein [Staphylococcus equorum]
MKKQFIATFKTPKYKIITAKNQIELLIRLKDLLEHGFTLSEAFSFLLQHIKVKSPKVTALIEEELKNGASCHQILHILKYPKPVVMLIYFSEIFSDLPMSLAHAHDYLLRNYKAKKALLKTLQYPLLLLMIFITMLIVVNHTIIPEFQNLYSNMDVQTSTLQQFLSTLIIGLPTFITYFIIFLLITSIAFILYYNTLSIQHKHKVVLTFPIIRKFFKLYKTYRIASEFSLFYKNGVNLQKIVEIYAQQHNDKYLNFLAERIALGTQNGLKLSEILTNIACFEKGLTEFIEEGEKKGRVEIELKLYSEMIISQIERYLQLLIKFIQPCIFTLLAFLIVSLYLVIMLPMFDLMQTIK